MNCTWCTWHCSEQIIVENRIESLCARCRLLVRELGAAEIRLHDTGEWLGIHGEGSENIGGRGPAYTPPAAA